MEKYRNFINNSWVDSESKETIKVEDPATTKIIGEISIAIRRPSGLAVVRPSLLPSLRAAEL